MRAVSTRRLTTAVLIITHPFFHSLFPLPVLNHVSKAVKKHQQQIIMMFSKVLAIVLAAARVATVSGAAHTLDCDGPEAMACAEFCGFMAALNADLSCAVMCGCGGFHDHLPATTTTTTTATATSTLKCDTTGVVKHQRNPLTPKLHVDCEHDELTEIPSFLNELVTSMYAPRCYFLAFSAPSFL